MAYMDDDESFSDAAPSEDSGEKAEGDNQNNGYEPFLLQKSACPGMEVGSTGRFRVEKVLDDQYQCVYTGEGEPEAAEEETDTDDMAELMS